MSYSASTRECSPLVFLIDAALEMMILTHLRSAVACECIKSYTMDHFHRNESAAHEWSICSLFHLLKPLTSDFRTSSHPDRNTFKQWMMSDHCFALGPSFTCLVIVDYRNLVDKGQKRTHRKSGHNALTFAFWPLLFHCFVTSRDKWSDRCGCGMCSAAHCRLNVL